MKNKCFISAFFLCLFPICILAQEIVWLYPIKPETTIGVRSRAFKTNTIIKHDRKVEVYTNIHKRAECLHISNKATNIIWFKEYVEQRPPPISGVLLGLNHKPKYEPIKIYDVYFSNKIFAILFSLDSRELYCQLFAYPPYPPKPLYHNSNSVMHDACCEVKTKSMVAPALLINTANVYWNDREGRVGIYIQGNQYSTNKVIRMEKDAQRWIEIERIY